MGERLHKHPTASGYVMLLRLLLAICAAPSFTAQADNGYVYNPNGQLVQTILTSGENSLYAYDPAGNIVSITHVAAGTPVIADVEPSSGPTGTAVTLYGSGFSTTPSANTVKFNGVSAVVTSASATQLQVTVPASATTGTIALTVGSVTAANSPSFTVTAGAVNPPPVITSVTATQVYTGDSITITGQNFCPNPECNDVTLGTLSLGVTAATSTSLTVYIPGSVVTLVSGNYTVKTPYGSATFSAKVVPGPEVILIPSNFNVGYISKVGSRYNIPVSYTITNKGAAYSTGSSEADNIYLSKNAAYDASATLVGQASTIGYIGPGKLYTVSKVMTSSQLPAGYLILRANDPASLPADQPYNVTNGMVSAAIVNPDLIVSNFKIDAMTATGTSFNISISYTVTNSGASPLSGAWSDNVYTSANSTYDASATLLGTANTGVPGGRSIAPGASYNVSTYLSYTKPPNGNFLIIRVNDSAADNAILVQDPVHGTSSAPFNYSADLAISNLSAGVLLAASSSKSGYYNFTWHGLGYTITNKGTATYNGNSWTDNAYASIGKTADATSTLLGSVFYRSQDLAPGATLSVQDGLSFNSNNIPTGNLVVKVDGPNAATDGQAAVSIKYPAGFAISNLNLSGFVTYNQYGSNINNQSYSIPISYTVKNKDTQAVALGSLGLCDGLYFSASTAIDGTATKWGCLNPEGSVAGGASYTNTGKISIPATSGQPTGNVIMRVNDATQGVGLVTAYNGAATLNPPDAVSFVPITYPIDLVISNLKMTGPITFGSNYYQVPITYTVTNKGAATLPGGSWGDIGYLSTKSVLDGTATQINPEFYFQGPDLAPGSSYTVNTNITMGGLQPPAYYLIVRANDPYSAISTIVLANPAHAVAAIPLSVYDLQISNLAITGPITLSGGQYSIPISYTVTNNSSYATALSWVDNAYLSSSSALDDTAVLLGTVKTNTTSLVPGASYTVTTTVLSSTGYGYLYIKTNAGSTPTGAGAMVETNSGNNVASVAFNADPAYSGEVPLPPWASALLGLLLLGALGRHRTRRG